MAVQGTYGCLLNTETTELTSGTLGPAGDSQADARPADCYLRPERAGLCLHMQQNKLHSCARELEEEHEMCALYAAPWTAKRARIMRLRPMENMSNFNTPS